MGKQHGLDFLTRACHTVVSIWQDQSMTYGHVTRACPCQAQV
ncbi:hypothetical protein F383_38716 [Gossypium arboreum]|uniref:Uncharacterized protein n=1 Tax=Gossypium arboreum TaxID=29729 RepID=A0A0B0MM35_GOSAR|nr:hypothetical protein F383_38716 [Gossypium arboreum]